MNKGVSLSLKGKIVVLKDLRQCHDFNTLIEHFNNSNFVTNILRLKNGKAQPKTIQVEDLEISDVEEESKPTKEVVTEFNDFYKGGDNSIFPSSNSLLQKIYFDQIKPLISSISSVFSYPNKNQIGKLNIHSPVHSS